MISGVSKVVVPVDDQERSKEFWVDRLGFELRRDESYGDERWIEVEVLVPQLISPRLPRPPPTFLRGLRSWNLTISL